ncbi:hypothetical protein [Glaciecola sp. 33A]|jgi:hypothetical protein|uniref:hypothetical protein n=1 Tax=Glaciecola sp. 33A TaxID=2057807 RepID=UPI000C31CE55|nr:hypothetical protein [Glaciecola sp. 33A]PKI02984.1 hypothetical protein CXF81_04115 [Glaciecola sp. 33A]
MPKVILEYKRWMKLTYVGPLATRSAILKKVDISLERYSNSKNVSNFEDLRKAVIQYVKSEGANWKSSKRNNNGAVQDLYRQVMEVNGPAKTSSDILALSAVKNESRAILTDLFKKKELEWRPSFWNKVKVPKKDSIKNVRTFAKNVNTISKEYVSDLVPKDSSTEVFNIMSLIPSFNVELAASVTPILGVGFTGASALKQIATASYKQYQIKEARMHQERSLSIGEPNSAISALIILLQRERTSVAARAAITTGEFGGKLGGLLLDAGTLTNAVVGMTAQLAKLTVLIMEIYRDVKERNAANILMQKPENIDITLFETCPILGAYLICCAPTSVMVNAIFEKFFEQAWKGEVVYTVKKHLKPLQDQAQGLVLEHRFWIPSLKDYPGMFKVNTIKLEAMEKSKGMNGIAWDNHISSPFDVSTTNTQGTISLQEAQTRGYS